MPQPHRDNPDNEVTHSNPTAQAFQSIINTDNASYQTTAVQSFVELYQRLDLKDHPRPLPGRSSETGQQLLAGATGPHLTLYWRDPAPATESDNGNTLEERPIQCLKLRLPGEAPWPTLTPRHEAPARLLEHRIRLQEADADHPRRSPGRAGGPRGRVPLRRRPVRRLRPGPGSRPGRPGPSLRGHARTTGKHERGYGTPGSRQIPSSNAWKSTQRTSPATST